MTDRTSEPILTISLVPTAQWGANLSQSLKGSRWDKLRHETYRRAGNQCEICSGTGRNGRIEAHEEWAYDEGTATQRLVRLIALCPACHEVTHFGRAQVIGRGDIARAHLMQVNGWDGRSQPVSATSSVSFSDGVM